MKCKFFLLFLVLMLCVAASSFAIELTFAQTCKEKTTAETQLYEMSDAGALQPAQTLPAGTYIITNGLIAEWKTGITYGFEQYGYDPKSVFLKDQKLLISVR